MNTMHQLIGGPFDYLATTGMFDYVTFFNMFNRMGPDAQSSVIAETLSPNPELDTDARDKILEYITVYITEEQDVPIRKLQTIAVSAAANGFVDVLRFLPQYLVGFPEDFVRADDNNLTNGENVLAAAIKYKRLSVVKYFDNELGWDMATGNSFAMRAALQYDSPFIVAYLVRNRRVVNRLPYIDLYHLYINDNMRIIKLVVPHLIDSSGTFYTVARAAAHLSAINALRYIFGRQEYSKFYLPGVLDRIIILSLHTNKWESVEYLLTLDGVTGSMEILHNILSRKNRNDYEIRMRLLKQYWKRWGHMVKSRDITRMIEMLQSFAPDNRFPEAISFLQNYV